MSLDPEIEALHSQLTNKTFDRRTLLKRATVVGLSTPAIASLLAACGGDDDDDEPTAAAGGDEPTATTAAGADETPEEETEETPEEAEETPETADETPEAEETEEEAEPTEDDSEAGSGGDGQPGGTLKVAMIGEPPTLDIHQSTGTIIGLVMWNVYEPLFAWDADFAVIPMLAEGHEVTDDGLLHTITLRQGVPFHNGEEMKAADVVASIEHWGAIAGVGKALLEATDEIVEVDDYTIEFRMNSPYGIFVSALALANGGCAIYPASVIEAANGGEVTEFIGTGPYRFVERQADAYIRLERFEDYAALPGDPNGYGGHKYAYVDRMEFVPVPDEAARIAGLQAGDYHYLENISPDQYEILEGDPNINAEVLPPQGWGIFFLNWESPITSNLKIRQAFQAALDHEAIAQAGWGEGYYRLDPGLMFQETVWYTDAGSEYYNINDPDLARQLLEEAGYDGTPLRWTATQEYQDHYNRSVVAIQQLEAVGFVIDFIVKDWATVLSEQFEKDKWEVTVTGISFRPDPALLFVMDVCNIAGWWCSEETIDLVDQLRSESDFDTRYALWEQIQENAYTEIPFIKVADALTVRVSAAAVQNLASQSQIGPILWNVWLDE